MNLLLIFLSSVSVFAAPPPLDATVSFDNVNYRVHSENKVLIYQGHPGAFRFPLKACSKAATDSILASLQSAITEKPVGFKPSANDVKVVAGKTQNSIARGSVLGESLREMPRRISYLFAESQVACRK
jgi:hypothetical protein